MQSPESRQEDISGQVEALLRKAIQLDDSLPAAHFLLGQLLLDENKLADSLSELRTAERQDPDSNSIHFVLQRVYRRLGKADDAKREFLLFEQTRSRGEPDSLDAHPNPATQPAF
jgi:lipopolysaccharide biosynthesis regulator YciM